MFLVGLKFALGLMTGVSLFTCASLLLLWSIELAGNWRKKRRYMQVEKGAATHLVMHNGENLLKCEVLSCDARSEAQHSPKYLQ